MDIELDNNTERHFIVLREKAEDDRYCQILNITQLLDYLDEEAKEEKYKVFIIIADNLTLRRCTCSESYGVISIKYKDKGQEFTINWTKDRTIYKKGNKEWAE